VSEDNVDNKAGRPKQNSQGISEVAYAKRVREGKRLEKATGWPWPAAEVNHVLGTPKKLDDDVKRWRTRLITQIQEGEIECDPALVGLERTGVAARVDEYTGLLREIARILALLHGTPDLGNKSDPVDELVYIMLSRKTAEGAYQEAFNRLKERFPGWDDVADATTEEIEKIIRPGGLSEKKAASIIAALQKIRDTFGSCSLDDTAGWSDEEVENFLCTLPEVQKKTAYCVMMYAMGRKVFPVDTHVGRILQRVAPARILRIDLDGQDHKKLQANLPDLVPPALYRSLHVNLIMHGREVCKAKNPACGDCEIARFCGLHRDEQVKIALASDAPIFMDFFCGAGGLSLGLSRAGFRPVLAVDSDPSATRTYKWNETSISVENVLTADIRELEVEDLESRLAGKRLDLMVGAPPCQGFSYVGNRSKLFISARKALHAYTVEQDDRTYLYEYFVGAALELRPRILLMENVPGMDSRRRDGPSYMQRAADLLEDKGYLTAIWNLNAASYGIPQKRQRKFLVASLTGSVPVILEREFQDRARVNFDTDALPPITLEQAIFDLPPLEADDGAVIMKKTPTISDDDPRFRFYLTNPRFRLKAEEKLIYNHRSRYQNDRDLELYALLRPGENSVHVLERYERNDLMRYRADIFDDKYSKMKPDEPSRTIVSHLAKDGNSYIHPEQTRSITPREAARVQSFPDDHVFCGSSTDQWTQIGNAVPPALACAIGAHLKEFLERTGRTA
jgi:DNA (cytosine-5)-methyltransferase 1